MQRLVMPIGKAKELATTVRRENKNVILFAPAYDV
jgi:hypothetical protein